MRYYQSLLDVDYLIRGHEYFELKKSYIIFICLYDPFGKGLPVYEFERICKQKNSIKFNDKSYFLCYNVKAFDKETSHAVREVLQFIANGKVSGETSQMISDAVQNIKNNDKYRRENMFSSLRYVDAKYAAKKAGKKEGLKLGIAQGAHEKAVETARNFLALGVNTIEQIAQATGLPLEEVQQLATEVISN